jgi:myo-inositol catabolism protein IolC
VQDQAAHLQAELDEAHDVLAHQTDKVTELADQVSSATAKATAAEEALRALRTDSDVQLADLRRERGVHLRELGQAQMRAQDAESQLSSARSQARTANQALADAKIGHEAELRDQVAEAQG